MRRAALVVLLALSALVLGAGPAGAHPLGNFTVNTADRIVVGPSSVRVVRVVDLAEIPTLQLRQGRESPDADRDGRTTDAELATWSREQCLASAPQLSLVLDGRPAELELVSASARTVPGQAGLATQRTECTLDTDQTPRARVEFSDPVSATRTGWKEVSASVLCGDVTGAPALPRESPSALLTRYPQDLLASPPAVTQVSFGVRTTGACRAQDQAPSPVSVLPRGVDRFTTAYSQFVGRQDLTASVALLAVLLSIVLGSGHALAPGHGKTVIAAYLVGQRGTRRQALWLGATVTATHTSGVLLLGALLSLGSIAAPERWLPAAEIVSGLLLGAVGVYLLRRALRARGAGAHGHTHDEHEHEHEHDHPYEHPHAHDSAHPHGNDAGAQDGHPALTGSGRSVAVVRPPPPRQREPAAVVHSHGGRAHSHAPLPDRPLGWRTLATMGVAGGLVPSPSALVVLLGASALGRPIFGAVLVLGYGVGMALTLTLAGLLLLRAQTRLDRLGWSDGRAARLVSGLPAFTACVVLTVGALIVLRGLRTLQGLS